MRAATWAHPHLLRLLLAAHSCAEALAACRACGIVGQVAAELSSAGTRGGQRVCARTGAGALPPALKGAQLRLGQAERVLPELHASCDLLACCRHDMVLWRAGCRESAGAFLVSLAAQASIKANGGLLHSQIPVSEQCPLPVQFTLLSLL